MHRIIYILLVLIINWIALSSFAQNAQKVDSLELSLTYATSDLDKIESIFIRQAKVVNGFMRLEQTKTNNGLIEKIKDTPDYLG